LLHSPTSVPHAIVPHQTGANEHPFPHEALVTDVRLTDLPAMLSQLYCQGCQILDCELSFTGEEGLRDRPSNSRIRILPYDLQQDS
jgi:hypothetical protein